MGDSTNKQINKYKQVLQYKQALVSGTMLGYFGVLDRIIFGRGDIRFTNVLIRMIHLNFPLPQNLNLFLFPLSLPQPRPV